MPERLAYQDGRQSIYVTTEQDGETPQQERVEWHDPRDAALAQAIATMRSWSDDAASTTVTAGNAVAVLQTVVNRLGVFFDRFADKLERDGFRT